LTQGNIDPGLTASSGLWGSGPGSVWAGGAAGNLLHFDGGIWSSAATLPITVEQLWGTSDTDFWAVGQSNILHFASGTEWMQQTLPAAGGVVALYGSWPTNVWAVGAADTLLHYDGLSWTASDAGATPTQAPSYGALWAASPNDAWIAGTNSLSHWDGG